MSKEKTYYYIFGTRPCNAYEEGDIKGVVNGLSGDGDLVVYPSIDCPTPTHLISRFDGYFGWIDITEEDYNKILQKSRYPNLEITF